MTPKISICVFAHYNAKMVIADYVYQYLESLKMAGFDIVFVSNSVIGPSHKKKLIEFVGSNQVFERNNEGNDFGAWKWVFENNLINKKADFLLLTNDSVFGPLFELKPLVDEMRMDEKNDFWGLTDSYQNSWHLQSYFILLNQKAFTSQALSTVFATNFSRLPKKDIIEKGEILLTRKLTEAGFTGKVMFPYTSLDDSTDSTTAYNSTHRYWSSLIKEYKFPFIKKELITHNPENIESIGDVFDFIETHTNYPVKLIKDFLIKNNETAGKIEQDRAICIICHLYYRQTIYYFLSKLAVLKLYNAKFIFNISDQLKKDKHLLEVLIKSFPGSIILSAPNQGRDIGGKLVCIHAAIRQQVKSDYVLVIHDKVSPHTPLGIMWRDKLLKIIDREVLPQIFKKFEKENNTGIISIADFIQNEYDPDTDRFTCTSSDNLLAYLKEYEFKIHDYRFVAGTIFWIKADIINRFFNRYNPLKIRETLEKGNVLDFANGTNIHAWERIFSMVASKYNYKISGI